VKTVYYDLEVRLPESGQETLAALAAAGRRPIIKTHVLPDFSNAASADLKPLYSAALDAADRLYVVRDGRDVMVSFYRFRTKFAGETKAFSEFLRTPSRPGGMTPPQFWAYHAQTWRDAPSVLSIRFEEALSDFANVLSRLASEFHLTRNRRPARPIKMTRSRFLRQVQRVFGAQRSSAVLPGQGTAGQWRSFFSDADRDFFRAEAGDALEALGYSAT
jgi:hypothetical protein